MAFRALHLSERACAGLPASHASCSTRRRMRSGQKRLIAELPTRTECAAGAAAEAPIPGKPVPLGPPVEDR